MNIENTPTNREQYFGSLSKEWKKIIAEIKADVEYMIENELLKEKSTNIIFVERKGLHLFHHTFNRLLEERFSLGSVRILKYFPFMFIKSEIHENVIICTDAINTGNEISTLISTFQRNGISIAKIFCYYANSEALDELVSQNLIKEDQVICVHKVNRGEKYFELAKRLNIYFQSRIEPTDMDHVYYLCSIEPNIKPKIFKKIVNSAAYSLFRDAMEFDDDIFIPKNVVGFSIEYPLESWEDLNFSFDTDFISNIKKFCDICYLLFRIKLEQEKTPQRFTIMGYIQLDDYLDISIFSSCPIKAQAENICLKDKLSYNKNEISDEEIFIRYCTPCFENFMSNSVLEKFQEELNDQFKKNGFTINIRRKYDPLTQR